MLLKNGERCRYKALKGGLCGLHGKEVAAERKIFDSLLKAGKYTAAATTLITFIEKMIPICKAAAHEVGAVTKILMHFVVWLQHYSMIGGGGGGLNIEVCLTKANALSERYDPEALSNLATRVFDFVDATLDLETDE